MDENPLLFRLNFTHPPFGGHHSVGLISYVRAISQQFTSHRKIARITFPIWLYITITGVIIYLMISPYYA